MKAANDTIPKNKKTTDINLIPINGLNKTHKKGNNKVVVTKEDDSVPSPLITGIEKQGSIPKNALLIVNGKEISNIEMKSIPSNNIQSINVLKGQSAEKKYGQKGKNGVIEITTKNISGKVTMINMHIVGKSQSEQKDTIPKLQLISKVFTKTEIPASFPGGPEAWQKYIVSKIQASLDSFTQADFGTCLVRFVVGVDGSVIGVEATTMKGTHLADVAINAIKNGPKWIPAKQNGHEVAAYTLQPVTLKNPDSKQPSTNAESDKRSTSVNTSKDRGMVLTE